VSFARYLKERRADFIDYRADHAPAPGPGVPLELDEAQGAPGRGATRASSTGGLLRRSRGARSGDPPAIRYRHVRPAFAPSPFAPPLPYVEPWERR
jgi:hypothetical protein